MSTDVARNQNCKESALLSPATTRTLAATKAQPRRRDGLPLILKRNKSITPLFSICIYSARGLATSVRKHKGQTFLLLSQSLRHST